MATKQRWYCSCGTKYKTKFGVLAEMIDGGMAYYALAPSPPQPLLDAKFMMIEERFKDKKTDQELLASLPALKPAGIGSVMTPTMKDGEFQLHRAMFAGLPKLEWMQILNLANL